MKAAVIGAGMIGYYHAHGLKQAGADIIAIADPVKELRDKVADEFGIPLRVKDYRDLLNEEIDFITVGTPNNLHRSITVDFLKAGKHVICEKPMARNLQEADDMLEAAEEYGRMLFVAHNHRFIPQYRLVGKLIKEGEIGRPFMVIGTFIGDEYSRMNDPENWKGTWEGSGGGVTIDNGAHMIDIFRSWFGEVKAVTAVMGTLAIDAYSKAEDTSNLSIEFENGILASLTLTFGARYNTWPDNYIGVAIRTEILGMEGAIQVGTLIPDITIIDRKGEVKRLNSSEIQADVPVNQFTHFMDCMTNGSEPIITAKDARAALAIIMAAYKSAKEKRRVLLSEI